jgi:hypothetical protein
MKPFLFILSTGHCGTTLLSQILAHCFNGYLPPWGNNEGQFCPELVGIMRAAPWDPNHPLPWDTIQAVWLRHLRSSGKPLFIEASPPNLIRFADLQRVFADQAGTVILTGNPYAYVASCLHYYHAPDYMHWPEDQQLSLVSRICRRWMERTSILMNLQQHPAITATMSYSGLCHNPADVVEALSASCSIPQLAPVESVVLQGKALQSNTITDLSLRNIAFLTGAELDQISSTLGDAPELLHFTGTPLLNAATVQELGQRHPEQLQAGRSRRQQAAMGAGR